MSCDSSTVTRRVLVRPPPILPKISPILMAPICAPGMPGISNIGMPPPAAGLHFDLDLLVVELALAQPFAKAFARRGAGAGADQSIEHALFRRLFGARLHVLALAFARQRDRNFDQVADDLLDVAADIADLGELGGFDFQERRAGQLGQAARNLGLADAGRPDHQDVLRQHFLAQFVVELQAAPAIAQRDGDGALGVVLADDEAVEFGNDFARREVGHSGGMSPARLSARHAPSTTRCVTLRLV